MIPYIIIYLLVGMMIMHDVVIWVVTTAIDSDRLVPRSCQMLVGLALILVILIFWPFMLIASLFKG